MKVIFDYNLEKDIWCLLNYGKGSNNSNKETKVYQELIGEYGDIPNETETQAFIEKYISENDIDIQKFMLALQEGWGKIADKYIRKAEEVFDISLPEDIVAYLTINNRCPYRISENFFFVSFSANSANKIAMHELWHFYTWYKFGIEWEDKLGKEKYNNIKESLTVLLNVECKDLLLDNVEDIGYPQHLELRKRILELWKTNKNIEKLWEHLI